MSEKVTNDMKNVSRAVPNNSLICIEHPGLVRSSQNALKTLGGNYMVDKLLRSADRKRSIGLSWQPDDPLTKRVRSRAVETNDLLLMFSLPKRTGRKRKRGSSDKYEFDNTTSRGTFSGEHNSYKTTALDLLKKLQNNPENISLSIVGSVQETHRFRDIPDFQTTMMDSISRDFRKNLLSDYKSWKDFRSDFQVNKSCSEVLPPPVGGQVTIPFNFAYLQNLAMKKIVGKDGKITTINTQMAAKSYLLYCSPNSETVPASTPASIPSEDTLDPLVRETIASLRNIMDERPIVTRRVIGNLISDYYDSRLRLAYPYVGYSFRKGPWKDSIIKYGVDPRLDPKYRFYQTVLFKLFTGDQSDDETTEKSKQEIRGKASQMKTESHIFDGRTLYRNGKVWQVCDIEDPLLKEILDTTEVRGKCEPYRDGWYHSGTWGKFKAIMKDKLDDLLAGKIPNDIAYRRIRQFPDQLDRANIQLASFSRSQKATEKEMAVSLFIRYWARHQIMDDSNPPQMNDDDESPPRKADDLEEDMDDVMDDVRVEDGLEGNEDSPEALSNVSDASDLFDASNSVNAENLSVLFDDE